MEKWEQDMISLIQKQLSCQWSSPTAPTSLCSHCPGNWEPSSPSLHTCLPLVGRFFCLVNMLTNFSLLTHPESFPVADVKDLSRGPGRLQGLLELQRWQWALLSCTFCCQRHTDLGRVSPHQLLPLNEWQHFELLAYQNSLTQKQRSPNSTLNQANRTNSVSYRMSLSIHVTL